MKDLIAAARAAIQKNADVYSGDIAEQMEQPAEDPRLEQAEARLQESKIAQKEAKADGGDVAVQTEQQKAELAREKLMLEEQRAENERLKLEIEGQKLQGEKQELAQQQAQQQQEAEAAMQEQMMAAQQEAPQAENPMQQAAMDQQAAAAMPKTAMHKTAGAAPYFFGLPNRFNANMFQAPIDVVHNRTRRYTMPTRADIIAAREAIDLIPKQAEMHKKAEGEQQDPDALYKTITTTYSSPEYWREQARQALQGVPPDQLEAAKKKFILENGKRMAAEIEAYNKSADAAASGGMFNRYNAAAGGIGAALGALVGGVFGGGKGALVGTLLGGLGMFFAQKFNLIPEQMQGMLKSGVDKMLGPNAKPTDKKAINDIISQEVNTAMEEQQAAAQTAESEQSGEALAFKAMQDREAVQQSAIDQGLGELTDAEADQILESTGGIEGFTPEAVGQFVMDRDLPAEEFRAAQEAIPEAETEGELSQDEVLATAGEGNTELAKQEAEYRKAEQARREAAAIEARRQQDAAAAEAARQAEIEKGFADEEASILEAQADEEAAMKHVQETAQREADRQQAEAVAAAQDEEAAAETSFGEPEVPLAEDMGRDIIPPGASYPEPPPVDDALDEIDTSVPGAVPNVVEPSMEQVQTGNAYLEAARARKKRREDAAAVNAGIQPLSKEMAGGIKPPQASTPTPPPMEDVTDELIDTAGPTAASKMSPLGPGGQYEAVMGANERLRKKDPTALESQMATYLNSPAFDIAAESNPKLLELKKSWMNARRAPSDTTTALPPEQAAKRPAAELRGTITTGDAFNKNWGRTKKNVGNLTNVVAQLQTRVNALSKNPYMREERDKVLRQLNARKEELSRNQKALKQYEEAAAIGNRGVGYAEERAGRNVELATKADTERQTRLQREYDQANIDRTATQKAREAGEQNLRKDILENEKMFPDKGQREKLYQRGVSKLPKVPVEPKKPEFPYKPGEQAKGALTKALEQKTKQGTTFRPKP